MIKSMTGYGIASADLAAGKYTIEIKSLNSKFIELSLKLPKSLNDKETHIRNIITKAAERGKVSAAITLEAAGTEQQGAAINKELFIQYYRQLEELNAAVQGKDTNIFELAMRMPEVINYEQATAETDDVWPELEALLQKALDNFNAFRLNEGSLLQQELESRIHNIQALYAQVDSYEAERIPAIQERITKHIREGLEGAQVDHNRLEQELIFYIEKLDITEEKIRLKTHCDYFLTTLAESGANGKKLNFIAQEIGREINTIGSKANHAGLQRLVVNMKEELEKVKEQLLNII